MPRWNTGPRQLELVLPVLGTIVPGRRVGFKSPSLVVWSACENCGAQRWVQFRYGRAESALCKPCTSIVWRHKKKYARGENHPSWKGGRCIQRRGYVLIRVSPDHPFAAMRSRNNAIFEHRLVMAEALGRPLRSHEIVHHRNGDKSDNRLENLELTSRERHSAMHHNADAFIARIIELEKENEFLKSRINRMANGDETK